MSANSVFYVKTLFGEIQAFPIASHIKMKDVTEIMKQLLPASKWYEPYWFPMPVDDALDQKENVPNDLRRIPSYPKRGETVCLVARPIACSIYIVDTESTFDRTHLCWYVDNTLVIEVNGIDILVIDFSYRETEQGCLYVRQYELNIRPNYTNQYHSIIKIVHEQKESGIRVAQFPRVLPDGCTFTSLYDLIWSIYQEKILHSFEKELNQPESVIDAWIRDAVRVWETKLPSMRKYLYPDGYVGNIHED